MKGIFASLELPSASTNTLLYTLGGLLMNTNVLYLYDKGIQMRMSIRTDVGISKCGDDKLIEDLVVKA